LHPARLPVVEDPTHPTIQKLLNKFPLKYHGAQLFRQGEQNAPLSIHQPDGTNRWRGIMDKSVHEARWLLVPVFSLFGIMALVGVLVS
jgi:hypothetical protein